jgi:molybdate transport system ATP-binding protein
VSLRCGAGQLLALVGPSGSGKTSVLRALAGLAPVEQGRISCGGRLWFDAGRRISLSPQKRRVGFVFQDYALFPHLSVMGNVGVALGHLSAGKRRQRAGMLLERVNLGGLEDRRPAELSGGQRQRVALARALAREPRLLLMDEPFSAVDQVTRRKLQRELAVLRRNIEIPMLLVTHDLDEAALLADSLCVIQRGRSLQQGPPEEVLSRPVSPQVAKVVDLRNVYSGRVVGHDAERGLTFLEALGVRLETPLQRPLEPGTAVQWLIPPSHVVLHRRERPSAGERENPVSGTVSELAILGETGMVTIAVGESGSQRLFFSVPSHVARRNGLAPGVSVRVSLLTEGIHIMGGRGHD